MVWGSEQLPGYLVIWSLPTRASTFHPTIASACQDIDRISDLANVFFGIGLQRQPERHGRGKADGVSAIPGLWADIDVAGPGHATTSDLFKSKVEVQSFLDDLPVPPSVVIDSGGGIHAYWLFREPLIIESPEDRVEAELLSTGWQDWLRSKTTNAIDATHDLSRVLRVPGTWNRKTSDKRHCKVLSHSIIRYNPSDFDDFKAVEIRVKAQPSAIKIDEFGEPPAMKLMAMRENSKKFKQTWERKRDFADDSDSSYCLALANFLVSADWDDQEIADTMHFWRQERGLSEQQKTSEWYRQTIAKARRDLDPSYLQKLTDGAKTAVAEAVLHPDTALGDLEPYAVAMQELGNEAGFEIECVQLCTPMTFSGKPGERVIKICTPAGDMTLPPAMLLAQQKFRAELINSTGILVPKMASKRWEAFSNLMIASAVEVFDTSTDSMDMGYLRDAIDTYMDREARTTRAEDAKNGYVYEDEDGCLWFYATHLRRWVERHYGDKVKPRAFTTLLQDVGCRRKTHKTGSSSTTSLWASGWPR